MVGFISDWLLFGFRCESWEIWARARGLDSDDPGWPFGGTDVEMGRAKGAWSSLAVDCGEFTNKKRFDVSGQGLSFCACSLPGETLQSPPKINDGL